MTSLDKSCSLYIDSCESLSLGILDRDLHWLEFTNIDSAKTSSVLYGELHNLMEKRMLSFDHVDSFFLALGPGSYTGIRLLTGIKDLYQSLGKTVATFYHFEVPKLLDEQVGSFICPAFKGEYFLYEWDAEKAKSKLETEFTLEKYRSSYSSARNLIKQGLTSTLALIEQNPSSFFSKVKERNLQQEAFYFRPLHKEFTVGGRN